MTAPPTPRPGIYELYWKFAYERQQVFYNRYHGQAAPWTDDPIIAEYKFCNVYRATDRISQYLIRNVCYSQENSVVADRIFQIVAFRFFSNIATWDSLLEILGRAPLIDDLLDGALESALQKVRVRNGKLYTGAFILCAADAYGRKFKHLNHIELFKSMFIDDELGRLIPEATSLQAVYLLLRNFPLIGNFMAYQIAIDLNYSEYVNFSENDFTQAGPGAVRGIQKVFADTNGMSHSEIIMWMVEHQQEEFAKLGYDFRGLFGRPLSAIDAQGLFCETDKYCRVAAPELKSARTKIKSKFSENTQPIELFFPSKWNLSMINNEK